MFRFLAKQGQHNEVAQALTARFNKPRLSPYSGPRGTGVMVEMPLPEGVTARAVNRYLYAQNIAGAVSARRLRVVRLYYKRDVFTAENRGVKFNEPFRAVVDRRFVGKMMLVTVDPGCECCGRWTELIEA